MLDLYIYMGSMHLSKCGVLTIILTFFVFGLYVVIVMVFSSLLFSLSALLHFPFPLSPKPSLSLIPFPLFSVLVIIFFILSFILDLSPLPSSPLPSSPALVSSFSSSQYHLGRWSQSSPPPPGRVTARAVAVADAGSTSPRRPGSVTDTRWTTW